MPNYIQDPDRNIEDAFGGSGSYGQKPGPQPDNYYDRTYTTGPHSMSKTPNYVLVADDFTKTAAFFFGSSASFVSKEAGAHHHLTASTSYQTWGGDAALNAGDRLDIHPLAWSGSAADKDKIVFVYKGGLDGQGRG